MILSLMLISLVLIEDNKITSCQSLRKAVSVKTRGFFVDQKKSENNFVVFTSFSCIRK
jgi:hypothetical protein